MVAIAGPIIPKVLIKIKFKDYPLPKIWKNIKFGRLEEI